MEHAKKYIVVAFLVAIIIVLIVAFRTQSNNHTVGDMTHEKDNIPVAQSHRSYEMQITSGDKKIKPAELHRVTYKIKNDKDEILKNFEIVHEKIMHLIIVRKDLQYFQHMHAEYDSATGEFTADITFPTDGPYVLYADFTPAKFEDNPQAMPVTATSVLVVGDVKKYRAAQVVVTANNTVKAKEYEITYKLPPVGQRSVENDLTYALEVKRNGNVISNFEPYLGAMGHSVVINAATLQYIHTHAGSHGNEGVSFTAHIPEPGIYKSFTEFQHEGKVVMVEYAFEMK